MSWFEVGPKQTKKTWTTTVFPEGDFGAGSGGGSGKRQLSPFLHGHGAGGPVALADRMIRWLALR